MIMIMPGVDMIEIVIRLCALLNEVFIKTCLHVDIFKAELIQRLTKANVERNNLLGSGK